MSIVATSAQTRHIGTSSILRCAFGFDYSTMGRNRGYRKSLFCCVLRFDAHGEGRRMRDSDHTAPTKRVTRSRTALRQCGTFRIGRSGDHSRTLQKWFIICAGRMRGWYCYYGYVWPSLFDFDGVRSTQA